MGGERKRIPPILYLSELSKNSQEKEKTRGTKRHLGARLNYRGKSVYLPNPTNPHIPHIGRSKENSSSRVAALRVTEVTQSGNERKSSFTSDSSALFRGSFGMHNAYAGKRLMVRRIDWWRDRDDV